MTEREAERLIEVFKRVVEEKLQEFSLRPNDVLPTAFEDKYMKNYTHGMYIDHILFRKLLRNASGGGGSIEHNDTLNKNSNPDFLHITETEKTNFDNASDFVEDFISNATNILYADLLALINNNELIPSSSYRITDYVTTTTQADTTSAGHDFDVIVTALSTNELSENAKCVRKSGDTYFENTKLEAWEIKYCINNDTSRFAWADSVNGKGVIYYMKDENNNELPYDFKNIQYFKNSVWVYTFGGSTDNSLTGGCHHNIMMDYVSSSVLTLNFNTFGNNCWSNTFGDNCHSNTFGSVCLYNTFGQNCYSNTFGVNCSSNTFDIVCSSNTFGDYCRSNTFGQNCYSNTFGVNCQSNTFGNYCWSNNFYDGTSDITKKDYLRYIVLEDGVRNNNFYSDVETSGSNYLQRIRIKGLEHNTPTDTQITLTATNTDYEWVVAKDSSGIVQQYCPEDRLTNNYTYKIEDTTISTWSDSTTYADYVYQAQVNIADLSEADSVNVVFSLLDAISGNYAPAIEIYSGYILVFAKVNTTIIIPTIEINKIDL